MWDGRVMVRLMRSAGFLALAGACAVVWLCARQWRGGAEADPPILLSAGVVEAFVQRGPPPTEKRASPLVAQARSLERYLSPLAPPKPAKPPSPKKQEVKREPVPAIRPVQATPKFTVRATSYNESRPEKSIALIAEPGGQAAHWVREGERIGHFVVHEIRPGSVVCLAGEKLQEMTLQRDPAPTAVASGDGSTGPGPSSRPRATAAASDAPALQPTEPSRRPSRANRRTVGSARTMALD